MIEQIKKELARLEAEKGVKILYAIESGSRAWGFESTDSDWDVRFIYVHRKEWYLSIDKKKDTIEEMLPGDLDLAGWELQKALRLFRKSNPPFLEWLHSPMVYLEPFSVADELRELEKQYFNPKSCIYHYLSMANRNWNAYFKNPIVKIKKYFYVLRPLLACAWIEAKNEAAPMEFEELVEDQIKDSEVKKSIQNLLKRKRSGVEMSLEPRIEVIDDFLKEKFEHFNEVVKKYHIDLKPSTKQLNELFRKNLATAWENNDENMMNPHLQKALQKLQDAGAEGIPTHEEVMKAKNGIQWSGNIADHGDWRLIKEEEDSYRTNTRHNVR